MYAQLILDKGTRPFNGEITFFKKWSWENWVSTHKRMQMDPYFTTHTNINSKPRTIKLLEENTGVKFHNIGLGGEFFDLTPEIQATKAKN